jgi:hypothetical protein
VLFLGAGLGWWIALLGPVVTVLGVAGVPGWTLPGGPFTLGASSGFAASFAFGRWGAPRLPPLSPPPPLDAHLLPARELLAPRPARPVVDDDECPLGPPDDRPTAYTFRLALPLFLASFAWSGLGRLAASTDSLPPVALDGITAGADVVRTLALAGVMLHGVSTREPWRLLGSLLLAAGMAWVGMWAVGSRRHEPIAWALAVGIAAVSLGATWAVRRWRRSYG